MPNFDFNFYAGGIEDGILEALRTPMLAIGVRSFATYSGQLDDENRLKAAIASQLLQYPFVMVSYTGGASVGDPKTSQVLGRPRHHRHDCSYAVIVADNNPQGEKARRRGKVFEMISVVWDTLVGVRLKKQVGSDQILLNTQPFDEPENVRIMLPDITAFGVIFDIAFKWTSPDRTTAGTDVNELIVGVNSLNASGGPQDPNLPGVKFEVGGSR